MTRKNDKQSVPELKALMLQNPDYLQPLVQWLLQEVLEAEMSDAIGAAKSERNRAHTPTVTQAQLNRRAVYNAQGSSLICHPTTLIY